MFQLSHATMAPNHQVSLSPEIPESSEEAVAQTEESLKSSVLATEATNATQPPKSLPSPSLQELDLPYKWMNIILISIFHVVATYGLIALCLQGYWISLIWSEFSPLCAEIKCSDLLESSMIASAWLMHDLLCAICFLIRSAKFQRRLRKTLFSCRD